MLSSITGADRVYIACGYTDLRRGIDGLAAMVEQKFRLDPFTNTLFLFCGRRTDRIKGLYWEGNGFVLLYKRLESGHFQWPRTGEEAAQLTPQQYRWLMEGLSVEQPKAHREIKVYPMLSLTWGTLYKALFEYIESWYNRQRIHGALGYKTPQQMEDEAIQAA